MGSAASDERSAPLDLALASNNVRLTHSARGRPGRLTYLSTAGHSVPGMKHTTRKSAVSGSRRIFPNNDSCWLHSNSDAGWAPAFSNTVVLEMREINDNGIPIISRMYSNAARVKSIQPLEMCLRNTTTLKGIEKF